MIKDDSIPIDDSLSFEIASVRAYVYRAPIEVPVVTSFGIMRDRPMVLVRVEGRDGAVGWGEIWCNYPSIAPEYRAKLVDNVLASLMEDRTFDDPSQAFGWLTANTAILALQSGEAGPFAQCIAGIDIALWDMAARRARKPLWCLLGGVAPSIGVYASGINPDAAVDLASARYEDGYRAFKLKVGFGADRDTANLTDLRRELGDDVALMVDANQAWSPAEALRQAPALQRFALGWLEEPLRADCPWSEWRALRRDLAIPLAGGENIAGTVNFDAAIASGILGVMQPDIAKWGGFSGNMPVARSAMAAGLLFCPHWLGGGVGLLASAHFLAAAGGVGMLEVDANPNALRTLTCGPLSQIKEGRAILNEQPGLGIVPDMLALKPFLVSH